MSGERAAISTSSEPARNHNPPTGALPRSIPTDLPESSGIGAGSSATTLNDGSDNFGTLGWARVIELRAFNEGKVEIEEKIRLLEQMPPLEVFGRLDARRSNSETISPELPTRADLQAWVAERDKMEEETDFFDIKEIEKLQEFSKAAAQRNLSPAETDLIELTLTTIDAIYKLRYLFYHHSKGLKVLALRLTWEEHRCAAQADYYEVTKAIDAFLENCARWSPSIHENTDGVTASVSRAKFAAEVLSREAGDLITRISSLRRGNISASRLALNKFMEASRQPVPETILDEQGKLERVSDFATTDLCRFVTNVVTQWRKADEIYVENKEDQASALVLIEEIETALSSHPTSHQSTLFTSRANALSTRVTHRGDPAAVENTFLRPRHTLFPEQDARNRLLVSTLSAEMAQSVELTQKAEYLVKKYHARCEIAERTGGLRPIAEEEHPEQSEEIGQKSEEGAGASDHPDSSLFNLKSDEGQLWDPNSANEAGKEISTSPLELSPLPALPQAPISCFSREEIVNEILDLTDQVSSTALFGLVGVGKSLVALSLLHHDRTKVKFGRNRHFMRCDDLANSLDRFLDRLSGAIGADRTTDIGQLRSHLESSPPLILLLDGVDSILDPLVPEAEDIFATIEEFGCHQHVCLLTTSRMYPDIPGFHRVEVPTLSGDDARDVFYRLCHLDRSLVVDELIAGLDFHPLLIGLLASSVRENDWDESTLLKAWDGGSAGVLKARYHQSLKAAVEPLFLSPTIQHFGGTARSALEAIAAFPCGVEERRILPSTAGVGIVVDILCQFSLVYREGGLVKMFSPLRLYFLDSMLEPARHVEVIHWDAAECSAAKGLFPTYTSGPIRGSSKVPSRDNWRRRFKSMKRRLRAFFDRSRAPIIIRIAQEGPADRPLGVNTDHSAPAPVPYQIE